MTAYTIRHLVTGDDCIADALYHGTKAEARQLAKDMAAELYPDDTIRWSGDARCVFRDGRMIASIGVEPKEAWRGDVEVVKG